MICLGVSGKQEIRISISAALLESTDVARQKKKTLCELQQTHIQKYFFLSLACCHPHAHAYSAFAATRSLFYSRVTQAIGLLLMKCGLIGF